VAKRVGLTLVERAYDALMPNPPGVADFAGVKRIALGLIDPHPEQPRRGALPEIPELAENVRRYGLLQPIVVAPPVAGRYQLIAGARRLAAFDYLLAQEHPGPDPVPVSLAQASPWAAIPAFVRDAGTLDRLLLALSENLARRDLSDADTVLAVRTLHDMHAWTATEIAARVGTSVGWISQVLGVARDPELADHVQAGRLSVAKAHEVRTAKDPALRAAGGRRGPGRRLKYLKPARSVVTAIRPARVRLDTGRVGSTGRRRAPRPRVPVPGRGGATPPGARGYRGPDGRRPRPGRRRPGTRPDRPAHRPPVDRALRGRPAGEPGDLRRRRHAAGDAGGSAPAGEPRARGAPRGSHRDVERPSGAPNVASAGRGAPGAAGPDRRLDFIEAGRRPGLLERHGRRAEARGLRQGVALVERAGRGR
jgi:ParB-like chromosome segregation protein Spo0J